MKDLASCFREQAIKTTGESVLTDTSGHTTTTTSIFKARLSSGKPLIINLTWSTNQFSIGVEDNPTTSMKFELLRKKKGVHTFNNSSSSMFLFWDFSAARYGPSPEPMDGYYFALIIDAQIALLLGDQNEEFLKTMNEKLPMADFSLQCRREQVTGRSLHSITKAKFGDAGKDHEISIRCRDGKEAELLVFIDRRKVVHVVKLNWNFRGNQIIFVDGLPVDLMWDMHGWWFGSFVDHAVFLFRQRRMVESRLWLEEEETVGFSLLIQVFRSC